MDLFSSMRVSASGIEAQVKRTNVIASNIANAQTTKTEEGGPYRKKQAVFQAMTDRESFGEILQNQLDHYVQGVQVTEIHEDTRPPRAVYNPSHPHADAKGYVFYPNINIAQEMADQISAQRSYEANITALSTAKDMAQKALELSR